MHKVFPFINGFIQEVALIRVIGGTKGSNDHLKGYNKYPIFCPISMFYIENQSDHITTLHIRHFFAGHQVATFFCI